MKGTFDCHGNLIHEGDIVKCSPGYEETLIPYTERYAGDLIIGEVIKCSQEFVYVLGVQTKGGWQHGVGYYLSANQVAIAEGTDYFTGFDLDSFNQMLGIGG